MVAQAVTLAAAGVLPVYLTGALAVQLQNSLRFDQVALGTAVAGFFVTTAVAAPLIGRKVDDVRSRTALSCATAASAMALFAMSLAPNWGFLAAFLVMAGIANAAMQPAVNLLLATTIAPRRLALAFGIKQAGVPVATMISGLSVPFVSHALGWRWAFQFAAAITLIASVAAFRAIPPVLPRVRPLRGQVTMPRRELIRFTIAAALASASASGLGTFLVSAGVASGLAEASAALVLTLASVIGLIMRVGLGWLVDSVPRIDKYVLIALLLFLGTVGYLLLATAERNLFLVASIVAYGAGWSWAGVLHYAIVIGNQNAPASATGIAMVGLALGSGIGPVVLGFVIKHSSFGWGWICAAALSLAACLLFLGGHGRTLPRSPSDGCLAAKGLT